jgi:hypothetical protein
VSLSNGNQAQPEQERTSPRWRLADIDFSRIDRSHIEGNEPLFLLLVASSFIESGAGLYTANLVKFFDGNPELAGWLRDCWQGEELQHGAALRAYVQKICPEFPWQAAYDDFHREYSKLCVAEELEPTRAQELVARCVVEAGTSSVYLAIRTCTDEPVLCEISENIRRDEVHHYKYFYHYFQDYRAQQRLGRIGVLRTLVRRLLELRNSDGEVALRHAIAHRHPQASPAQRQRMAQEVNTMLRRHLPVQMTLPMLLKPLNLGARAQKALQGPLLVGVRFFFSRATA